MFHLFSLRGKLLAFALMLVSFFSCHKDYSSSLPEAVEHKSQPNYPITLFEAMAHFANVQPTSSLTGNEFLDLDPLWPQAYLSQSQLGTDIVVVPLADTSLRVLNDGCVDAKLLFSKEGPDEISVEILVYVADSAYHVSSGGHYSLDSFTGVLTFYDIGQNFRHGVYLKNGAPLGIVDSMTQVAQTPNQVQPRTNNDCCRTVTITYREICWRDQAAHVDGDGDIIYCWRTVHSTVCDCVGGGGNGGTTTSNGGTTGGTPIGNGNGGSTGDYDHRLATLWAVLRGHIPIGIFSQNPTLLPPGFDTVLVRKFMTINNFFNFSFSQLEALQKRPDLILALYNVYSPWMSSYYDPNPPANQPNFALAKPVLDFVTKHKLTGPQMETLLRNGALFGQVKALAEGLNLANNSVKWLIENPSAAEGINLFHANYDELEGADEAALMLVEYATTNNITNPLTANFEDYGEDAFPCGPCFTVAWSVEYAILKKFEPCPAGDKACDWKLRAKATWNVISTGVHVMLDVAGLVPVYGEVFDVTNGLIYTLEGSYADAALSAGAAIPFVGWTATTAKYARKSINLAGNSMQLKYVVRTDGIIIFGGNLESARKQLRTMLKTPSGYQAHHIVPWEYYDHPVIQAAASVKVDGFHMNDLINGISLPTTAGNSLPKHLGSHQAYSERVRASLNKIETDLGPNIDPIAARAKLIALTGNINFKILNTPGGTIDEVSGWIDP
ncbi:MAG: AHH domain-containing protein [Saprospiraceae bacterium]